MPEGVPADFYWPKGKQGVGSNMPLRLLEHLDQQLMRLMNACDGMKLERVAWSLPSW